MTIISRLGEAFGRHAEHGIKNNLLLIGATALIGIGIAAESSEAVYPFEALAVIAVAGPAACRIGAIHGINMNIHSGEE